MIILWAAFGWLVGLTVMVAVYFAVVCTELERLQMTVFRQQVASHDEELVLFVGAEVVRVGEKDVEGRMLVVIGTKLVLENLLQLWLQSSYLSLSFETMDSFARWQAMASIGAGLLVAGSSQKPRLRSSDAKAADSKQLKHVQNPLVMTHPLPQVAKGSSCVIGVGMMLAGFGGLAWIVLEDFTCAPKSFRCPASPPTCRVCYCGGSLLRDAHPEAVGSTAFAVNQEACELRAMGLRLLLALVGLLEGIPEVRGELQLPPWYTDQAPGVRQLADAPSDDQKASASAAEEAESVKAEESSASSDSEDSPEEAKAKDPVEEGPPAVDALEVAKDAQNLLEKVHQDIEQRADRISAERQKVADASTGEAAKDLLQDAKAEVQAVEKSAQSTADRIERLAERLGAEERQAGLKGTATSLHEETREITATSTGIPWNAVWPCAVMVLLIYIYLAVGILTPDSMGYEPLEVDRRDPALVLAAVLYWVVMPIALVTLGFGATCEQGAPILAYITYGVCFSLHFLCIFWAMTGSLKRRLHDSTPKLIFMLGMAALEHFDMASDALFTGGGFMVPTLSKLGFSGVALMLFVTNAYVPQLLVVWAPFAPFAALSFVVMVILWASFGWVIGLSVILVVYALVLCSPLGAMEMEELKDEALRSDEHMSIYLGAEVVEAKGPKEKRPLVIMGTKLVLENLLQLWLQSSYLSLSFDRMDNDARWQAMASIGVGLLVAGGKGIQISVILLTMMYEGGRDACRDACEDCQGLSLGMGIIGVFMILAGFGGLAWVLAKVVFIFRCESHVWNLSTGCVSPEI
ncbi:unnamed protein product [Symbiodinium sp. KB8]|nr:unnamed protein product [Symbiodinium sp. KB8]